MANLDDLIKALSGSSKHEIFWLGKADDNQVALLEKNLKLTLPSDFKDFLLKTGGGGVVEQEISGIEDNNAIAEFGGTVFYDTNYCRNEFDLPEHLIVICLKDDDVCWCIDASAEHYGQVVSYDLFLRKIANTLNSSFIEFFSDYVNLRI